MSVSQISVFLENRPGELAEITGLLAAQNIDLRALNIAETTDYGVIRLITNCNDEAARSLNEAGFILFRNEVTAVAVPDQPGGLNRVLKLLAAAGIDIAYMYSIFSESKGKAFMIRKLSDSARAEALLEAAGLAGIVPGTDALVGKE